jgi:tetratricopeptide (TPR) repeat protein
MGLFLCGVRGGGRRVALALGLTAALAAPRSAGAAPPTTPPPAPASGSPAAKQEAKALYDQGLRYYNITEYDNAIIAFKKGYELSSEPAFLYNIGQAYRLKGDCVQATRFYRNYLREAGRGPQRADAEKWLKRCETDEAKHPAASPAPAAAAPAPSPTVTAAAATPGVFVAPAPASAPAAAGVLVQTAPAPASAGRGKRVAGIATAATGVVLLGASVAFGLEARSKAREVEDFARTGGTWNPAIAETDASGKTAATWANVFLVTGSLAAVGGGVLYYLGVRARDGGAPVALSFDGRALALGLSWRY